MAAKPYKATSLAGAQREVRMLRKLRDHLNEVLERYARERKLMAMVAADGPAFNNPLEAMAAKTLRDTILREGCRLNPDGTPLALERTTKP